VGVVHGQASTAMIMITLDLLLLLSEKSLKL
jgi:hypothetical protein